MIPFFLSYLCCSRSLYLSLSLLAQPAYCFIDYGPLRFTFYSSIQLKKGLWIMDLQITLCCLILIAFIRVLTCTLVWREHDCPQLSHTLTRTHSQNSTSPGLGIEEPEIPFRSQVLRSSTHLNRTSFPSPTPFDTLAFFSAHVGTFPEPEVNPHTHEPSHTHSYMLALTHAYTHTQYVQCTDFSVQE